MVERVISRIAPLNRQAMAECQLRLDNLIKPLNSLGAFEKNGLPDGGRIRRCQAAASRRAACFWPDASQDGPMT